MKPLNWRGPGSKQEADRRERAREDEHDDEAATAVVTAEIANRADLDSVTSLLEALEEQLVDCPEMADIVQGSLKKWRASLEWLKCNPHKRLPRGDRTMLGRTWRAMAVTRESTPEQRKAYARKRAARGRPWKRNTRKPLPDWMSDKSLLPTKPPQ